MHPTPPVPRIVSVQRSPADIVAAVDAFMSNEDNNYLVFVIEKRAWENQLALISQARAATLHNRVLFHRSGLSPVGVSALLDICSALAPQLSVAQLLAACERLEDDIACFALVKSVAKLTAANPSMWQHLISWWPTTTFVAKAGGQVINAKKLAERRADFAGFARSVFVSQEDPQASGTDVLATVRDLASPSSTLSYPKAPSDFWGTPTLAEWCFAPADIAGLAAQVQQDSHMCEWCQEPFVSPYCPVCSSPSFFGGPQS